MKLKSSLRIFLYITGSTLFAIHHSHAADGTWIVDAAGPWSTATNWQDSIIADGADFTAFLTANITAARTITLDTPRTIGNITFTDSTTPSHDLTLAGTGTNILTLDVTDPGSPLIDVTQAGRTLSITAPITGADGLTKSGPGNLILNNATNNYTGKTLVNGGVLQVGVAAAGNLSLPGGVTGPPVTGSNLELNGGIVSYWSDFNRNLGDGDGQIQLTGGVSGFALRQNNVTNLTFGTAGTELVWGIPAFNPSTLVLNDALALSAAPITFNHPLDLDGENRTISAKSAAGAANNAVANDAFGRVIGAGGLFPNEVRNSDAENVAGIIKTGVGTIGLVATNTYNGGTTVNQGGVFFDKLVSMPATGTVAVNDGGSLIVSVGGEGQWTIGGNGNGTFPGLLAGFGGQNGSTVTYSGNVAVGLNLDTEASYPDPIANISGTTSTGLILSSKNATGILTVFAENSYTGAASIRSGTLIAPAIANAGVNSAIGAYPGTDPGGLVLGGGTLRYTGGTATTNRSFDTTAANSTINIENENVTLSMGNYQPTVNLNPGLNVSGGAGSSLVLDRATVSVGINVALNSPIPILINEVRFTVSSAGVSPNFGSAGAGAITVKTVTNTVTNGNICVGGNGATITESVDIGTGLFLKAGGATWTFTGHTFTAGSLGVNGATGGLTFAGSSTINGGNFAGNIGYNNAGLFLWASSADQILGGVISSANGRVTMDGSRTLTLNGANTYGGATTVNSGTLLVNGSTGASAVAVNGGLLGGSGTIGGSVTVNGGFLGGSLTVNGSVTVAPDGGIAPGASIGTLAIVGGLNVSAMANGAGKLKFELGPIAASDKITVGGTLTIGDGVLGFNDFDFTNVGGMQIGTYKLVTSGAAVNGTLDGLDLTGTIGDFECELKINGSDLELVVGGDYGLWALQFAPADLSNPDADFDGDGVSNNQERIFGLNPTRGSSVNPISVPLNANTGTFSFTRRDPSLTGLLYQVWYSTDLVDWQVDTGAALTPGTVVDQVQTVAAQLSEALFDEPKLFLRVGAGTQPPAEPLLAADFEADNGNFTVETFNGTTTWAWGEPNSPSLGGGAVTEGAGGSARCWGTNLVGPYAGNTDTALRSPIIDLTGVSGATLSFSRVIDSEPGHTLTVNVIDDTTSTVIANIIPATQDNDTSSTPWQTIGPVAIPEAALGQAVRIEWRFVGNGDGFYNGVYIDNVVVTETP